MGLVVTVSLTSAVGSESEVTASTGTGAERGRVYRARVPGGGTDGWRPAAGGGGLRDYDGRRPTDSPWRLADLGRRRVGRREAGGGGASDDGVSGGGTSVVGSGEPASRRRGPTPTGDRPSPREAGSGELAGRRRAGGGASGGG
ncbi:hypothetical protein E2562_024456 [Oryza meyeriana var. granulata]|uniref:Uncharacterized protein n=1 Tax=Oryza meyeriana var. granulata TaxID=110450 RepID=A0A6G1EYL1_9ORYZ|nr:hypothetical protein E2562_024456 [Oryza meyeriana var. granulata]